ncbi:MAG TPA: T9SS type A sorting domain-containing protein [Taishania sp.]|nr:T9SS type A sorting domain-containing protein [Taishania sp.]
MKLTLGLTTFILAQVFFGHSQITLNEADFAGVNQFYSVRVATGEQVDVSTTGQDQVWDFSSLNVSNQEIRSFDPIPSGSFLINMAYGPTAVTAYRATYCTPTQLPIDQVASFLPIDLSDVKQYTKKASNKLTLVGYSAALSGQQIAIKSDTIESKYYFPMTYGLQYVTRGYTHFDMSIMIDAHWIQSRRRESIVDGWGTLITPYGSYDVLRVKHQIDEIDTVRYTSMSFGTPLPRIYEYEWLAAGEYIPVMKVTTTEIGGNETVVSVEIKDDQVILGVDELAILKDNLSVFPNPVEDQMHIYLGEGLKTVKIMTVLGQLISSEEVTVQEYVYDSSDLQPGYYMVTVERAGSVTSTRFVKQ